MIVRMWHGRTAAVKADEYQRFLEERALPDYRGVAGNRYAAVFRREDGPVTHFVTFTIWDSIEAIRAFAGDDVDVAKYYQEDQSYLLEFEPNVVHYRLEGSAGTLGSK